MSDERNFPPEPVPRRRRPAGQALAVIVVALLVASLLNADRLDHTAHTQPFGSWQRTWAIRLTSPIKAISHATMLNRPRKWLSHEVGNDDPPPPEPTKTVVTAPPVVVVNGKPVPAEEAVYPHCVAAGDGEALDGAKRYRIVVPGDDLPPVDAFWSYTVYGEDLFFVANPIDRYSISGETPGLVAAADGTITIALQPDDPADPTVNWLPTPKGPFTLVMRCYLPRKPILDGTYRYPPVQVAS